MFTLFKLPIPHLHNFLPLSSQPDVAKLVALNVALRMAVNTVWDRP